MKKPKAPHYILAYDVNRNWTVPAISSSADAVLEVFESLLSDGNIVYAVLRIGGKITKEKTINLST